MLDKVGGLQATSSQRASFFFSFKGITELQAAASANVSFKYQCKDHTRAVFSDCVCPLPKTGPWDMCQLYDYSTVGVIQNGIASFSVRAVAGNMQEGQFIDSSPTIASRPANFTWKIGVLV